ncbi:MAG TPA: hypothetical protein V6C91_03985 [Coleofasciculaceae cyanobacterium]
MRLSQDNGAIKSSLFILLLQSSPNIDSGRQKTNLTAPYSQFCSTDPTHLPTIGVKIHGKLVEPQLGLRFEQNYY